MITNVALTNTIASWIWDVSGDCGVVYILRHNLCRAAGKRFGEYICAKRFRRADKNHTEAFGGCYDA